ncbi:hypothetical protein OsJ_09530 [Oryza sativa Japonica Group]|uniref:FAR1 domain-containing protein n=1 Tax=Oryza sativa subsp. japonica TaxID=39947 RepID=B9FBH6_ORYSJ|nr:hypothetical protein OsJ_09530 [Oryza sativa Japonica Group]
MKFSSEDEGFAFYNQYAKEKGFSVRKDYSRRDRFSGLIFHKRFTCSREGFRKEVYMDYSGRTREPRALTHCGCNAHFEIKLDEIKGHWYVTRYGSIYTWSDQMERYRLLRCLGSEAFFKSSMTEESTVKVMKMLENLMLEEDSSENYENFDIEFGYVVGQSSRNDIESGDMVLDPTQIVPKGAPTKRMRGFLEKRK